MVISSVPVLPAAFEPPPRPADRPDAASSEPPAPSQPPGVSEPEKPPSADASGHELTPDEQAVVRELQARDAEVKAHEAAHASIGGGSPSYSYQRGPDGRSYAVGGEVQIDASGGSTPRETIAKMQRVRAAALAPANPSGQDRSVAASASRRMAAAQAELAKEAAAKNAPQRSEDDPETSESALTAEAAARPGHAAEGHDHVPGQDCPHCAPKVGKYTAAGTPDPAPRLAVRA